MAKIGAMPILAIGFAVGVVGLAFGYFRHYDPNMQTAKIREDEAGKWETEARKLPAANAKRKKAKEDVQKDADTWQKVVAVRTPAADLAGGGIDISQNPIQLTVDTRKYRNSVQTWVNRQVKHGGVVVDYGGDAIPMPGEDASTIVANYFNYPAMPFPVVIYDLGQVRVHGTWGQIQENIRGWSQMPNYLAVADGLTLDGTGTILNATYNVTIVGYIRGDKISPSVPDLAGAALTSAAGGGAPPTVPNMPGPPIPAQGRGDGKPRH